MVAQPTRTPVRVAGPKLNSSTPTHFARRFVFQVLLLGATVSLALLFSVLCSPLQAQTINCAPGEGCPQWTNTSIPFDLSWYVNPGCAGCWATVSYRFRPGCNNGNSCEIEILSISFNGTCNGCTIGDIIKYSIVTALINSCAYPNVGECVDNVQVWMAACQKKTHIGDFSYITSDCTNEDCCSAEYRLCRIGTGGFLTLTRTDIGTLPTQPRSTIDLATFYPTDPFSGCFMVCDAMPGGEIGIELN